jgi:hypothetical protein
MFKDIIVTKVKVNNATQGIDLEMGERLQKAALEARPKVGKLMPTTNYGVKVPSSRENRTKREEENEMMARETARIYSLQKALMSPRIAKVVKKVGSKTKLDHSDIGCVGVGSTGG